MPTLTFTTIKDGGTAHMMIIGQAGQGKSALLQAEARRLNIAYEELLQRLEPSEEQKERQRMRQEDEDRAEKQRLNAVREAFWHNTPEGHHDLSQLHSVLTVSDIVEEPTADQLKAFFMMLPADIIGAALSWGFDDTEVRERIYEFVEQNKQAVFAAIKAASGRDREEFEIEQNRSSLGSTQEQTRSDRVPATLPLPYSFRAECVDDVQRFFQACKASSISLDEWDIQPNEHLPDVYVHLKTPASLEVLRGLIRQIVDGHVMLQTLRQCALADNPMTRDFEIK